MAHKNLVVGDNGMGDLRHARWMLAHVASVEMSRSGLALVAATLRGETASTQH